MSQKNLECGRRAGRKGVLWFVALVAVVAFGSSLAYAEEGASVAPQIELGANGLSVLPKGSVVTKESLAKAFVGYEIKATHYMAEGEKYETFSVMKGEELVATVEPGMDGVVYLVEVSSALIAGPEGLHVGSAFEALAKQGTVTCNRGFEERSESAFCEVDGVASVRFVVDISGAKTGECVTGCPIEPKYMKALAGKKVAKLSWLAE